MYGFDNWLRAFNDPTTISALWMSFLLAVARLIPAIIVGVMFAWLIARTDMPGGNAIEFLCWVAYFIPDFPLTLAWILLLDPNYGFLNTLAQSSAVRRRAAVQSVQLLGHRLGAHFGRRYLV